MKIHVEHWVSRKLCLEFAEHRTQSRYTLRAGRLGVSVFVRPAVENAAVFASLALWCAWVLATLITIL